MTGPAVPAALPRPPLERAADAALAATLFASAAATAVRAGQDVPLAAGGTLAALQAAVGVLFLARRRAAREALPGTAAAALPGVLVPAAVLAIAPPAAQWPSAALLAFVGAGAWTIVSLAVLGRSFAVLPAARGVVARGPYRLVRHPVYLGELAMLAACLASRASVAALWPLAVALPLVALRIAAEERLLAADPAYRVYAGEVRWRLFSRVW